MRKNLKVISTSAVPVLSIEEIKRHCKVVSTGDDLVLGELALSSLASAEKYLNKHLLETTIELQQDDFEYGSGFTYSNYATAFLNSLSQDKERGVRFIQLKRQPIISITSVKFTDTDGNETTVDNGDYYLDNSGRVVFLSSLDASYLRQLAGIKVTYKCGYGTKSSDIPIEIKIAIKNHIFFMYNAISIKAVGKQSSDPFTMPLGIMGVYDKYRNINGI